ncbi:MAG: hypothetical protein IJW24_01120, partial [Clostridia bacterium]|nr:hypothetical protein [Clostridia bacterium]
LDLRGVIIECKYSDGTEKLIYDVEKYITEVSSEFVDPNLTDGKAEFFVAAASQSGYVKFMCEGQTLNLVAKTYAETVTGIAEVRMEKTVFDASDTIKYGDILVFVAYDKLGNKLLSETEIMNNVRAFLGGVRLEENPTEGYLLPSAIASGENVLEFVYVLNGNEYSFEVAVTIN